jgi:drug/metabolite transporter (DMT)-like permease
MTVVLLGLGAALLYGTADFLGGAAARRATTLSVLAVSLLAGLAVLLLTAIVVPGPLAREALGWGFAGGVAGGTGLFVFYGALAKGPMSVVAPVSALVAAVLPIGVGVVRGERLGGWVLVGVALCVIAIVLVSAESEGRRRAAPRAGRLDGGPALAVVSGALFAAFFVALKQAGEGGTVWPLVSAKVAGVVVVLAVLLAIRLRGGTAAPWSALRDAGSAWIALGAGVFDSAANALFLLATREGMLSLAVVLAAMYPAITVLLARLVYRERLRSIQRVGLAVAGVGVVLVTAG